MTCTTIKAIFPGEKADDIAELKNAWGSAPYVWDAMCKRHLNGAQWWSGAIERLWPLWKDQSIPEHQRAVLALTYDNMYLLARDYSRAASDIRKFLGDFPDDGLKVCHWAAIADLLESAPDCPAIGFHMNSVSEDPWSGDWDDDVDDYGPIDWSKAWSIYDELDKRSA